MASNKAIRRILPALLLVVCLAAAPAAGNGSGLTPPQQDARTVQAEGLRLVRHTDDTYELAADGIALEALVAHLAALSGIELTVDPELLATAVTIETERIGLSGLLEQLRASMAANLILAGSRSQEVSRAWFTATTAAAAPATGLADAAGAAVNGAEAGGTPTPMLQGTTPPPGMMPVPTGNEVHAAGYDPGVDMAEYIRNRAAATEPTGENNPAGGATGQPGEAAEAEPAGPPIPMDPNALENFFAGDSTTHTYHRLNCIQAMYLPAVNKVWFKSRQEAIAAGYEPHDICIAR